MSDTVKFNAMGIMEWETLEKPFEWKSQGLVVIADRHLPDGRRQHAVQGKVAHPTVINNADIFGEDILTCTKKVRLYYYEDGDYWLPYMAYNYTTQSVYAKGKVAYGNTDEIEEVN